MNTCNGSYIKTPCLYNLLRMVVSFGTNLDYRLVYRKGGLGVRSSCLEVSHANCNGHALFLSSIVSD